MWKCLGINTEKLMLQRFWGGTFVNYVTKTIFYLKDVRSYFLGLHSSFNFGYIRVFDPLKFSELRDGQQKILVKKTFKHLSSEIFFTKFFIAFQIFLKIKTVKTSKFQLPIYQPFKSINRADSFFAMPQPTMFCKNIDLVGKSTNNNG